MSGNYEFLFIAGTVIDGMVLHIFTGSGLGHL